LPFPDRSLAVLLALHMLLLLQWLEPWLKELGWYGSLEPIRYITFRASLASVSAFVAALVFGPKAIRMLRQRCPERVVSDSQHLERISRHKDQTPTMGGLFVLASIVLAVLLWGDLENLYVQISLGLTAGLGALGAIDDYVKLRGSSAGLSVRAKLIGQLMVTVPVAWLLYRHHAGNPAGLQLEVPFTAVDVPLGAAFVPLAVMVIVASSNAVNLTDGLDGLAGGCLIFAGTGMGVLSYLAGHVELAEYLSIPYLPGASDLTVTIGAMVGAVMGFLWFNCYPAQVFLGDTGSLPLGGLLGLSAVVTRQEWLLVLVGGVFVAEAASVLVQVGFYKWKKQRVLLCAPLHHHFQFKGWHETKIVVRFWIAAAVLAILAVASLKIR
jgi:phospho-N-acetylmuramoyl-pentapeptide-transferase